MLSKFFRLEKTSNALNSEQIGNWFPSWNYANPKRPLSLIFWFVRKYKAPHVQDPNCPMGNETIFFVVVGFCCSHLVAMNVEDRESDWGCELGGDMLSSKCNRRR